MGAVDTDRGGRPLQRPNRVDPLETPPFTRLARAHAATVAGDTLVAMALAGSLFFSISPNDARPKVALYLLLTAAPFAVVAPLIGPALDRRRGGRRAMVILAAALRAAICLLMIDDIDSLLLFPEAFAVLVLGKGYSLAKSALVPGFVDDAETLVEANSKLTLISGIVGFLAGIPGVGLLQLGSTWVLGAAALAFAVAALLGLRLPSTTVATAGATTEERAELRSPEIVFGASAMGLLRGIVGFLTFLLAFTLRKEGAPAWWFGIVLASSAVGSLIGAAVAPILRRHVREERILMGVLGTTTGLAILMWWWGGRVSAAILASMVAIAASAGKLAFDSIVQRDAPDANQGRSFARFETRFQLVWVCGALLPVLVSIPRGVGFLIIAAVSAFAAVSFWAGLAQARRRPHDPLPDTPGAKAWRWVASRLPEWPLLSRLRPAPDDEAGRPR